VQVNQASGTSSVPAARQIQHLVIARRLLERNSER
jgi:hypothetical protein